MIRPYDAIEHDGSEGPLTMARRFLTLSCEHHGTCIAEVERILSDNKERAIPDSPEYMISGMYALKAALPHLEKASVDCVDNAARVIYAVYEKRALEKDKPFRCDQP